MARVRRSQKVTTSPPTVSLKPDPFPAVRLGKGSEDDRLTLTHNISVTVGEAARMSRRHFQRTFQRQVRRRAGQLHDQIVQQVPAGRRARRRRRFAVTAGAAAAAYGALRWFAAPGADRT